MDTVVSEQVGPRRLLVLQLAPVSEEARTPEANDTMNSTYCARIALSAGDIPPDVLSATLGDAWCDAKPHIGRLKRHLDGHLEVPGTSAGPVPVSTLIDSGSGHNPIVQRVH